MERQRLYTWTPLLSGSLMQAAGFERMEARVLTQAWPPGWPRTGDGRAPMFQVMWYATAVLGRHREMLATAYGPPAGAHNEPPRR